MISGISIKDIASAPGVSELRGCTDNADGQKVFDLSVLGVAIDSRDVAKGSVFVALKGARVDGHAFISQARESGAVAAVVERFVEDQLPQIRVQDSVRMLGEIAKKALSKFTGKVIAITGSSGKTSVKNMTDFLLSASGKTIATKGNRNNEIGVPLSIFDLDDDARFLVLEMGAAEQGDIAYLVGFAQPDVALVNNIGSAHVGRFGSIENTARTKAEIYSGLELTGTAVVNLDDRFSTQILDELNSRRLAPKVITFSCESEEADIFGEPLDVDSAGHHQLSLRIRQHVLIDETLSLTVEVPQPGRHSVSNLLASIAIAVASGVTKNQLSDALSVERRNVFKELLSQSSGRLSAINSGGQLEIIDDAYNANPESMRVAIDHLSAVAKNKARKSILLLGDMGELGADSESYHSEVGAYAAQNSIDVLFAVGFHAEDYARGFNSHKKVGAEALVFGDQNQLIQFFAEEYSTEVPAVMLVKGSRSSAMEVVIQKLVGMLALEETLC